MNQSSTKSARLANLPNMASHFQCLSRSGVKLKKKKTTSLCSRRPAQSQDIFHATLGGGRYGPPRRQVGCVKVFREAAQTAPLTTPIIHWCGWLPSCVASILFVDESGHEHDEFVPTTAMVVSCTAKHPFSATRESRSCRRASTCQKSWSFLPTCFDPKFSSCCENKSVVSCYNCVTKDCNRWSSATPTLWTCYSLRWFHSQELQSCLALFHLDFRSPSSRIAESCKSCFPLRLTLPCRLLGCLWVHPVRRKWLTPSSLLFSLIWAAHPASMRGIDTSKQRTLSLKWLEPKLTKTLTSHFACCLTCIGVTHTGVRACTNSGHESTAA